MCEIFRFLVFVLILIVLIKVVNFLLPPERIRMFLRISKYYTVLSSYFKSLYNAFALNQRQEFLANVQELSLQYLDRTSCLYFL